MKLLIFAHVPPPLHGQSYMVKLLLDGLGGDCRKKEPKERAQHPVQCYHVNAQFSETVEDIGSFRIGKLFLLLRYCLSAIFCRFRHGVRAFYYVPAPGKRAALVRDWIVMLFCKPFFRHFIHHWEAAGMGDWLEKEASWIERRLTHWLLGRPRLGIALAIGSMRDPLWFRSKQVEVIPNAIIDPFPDFENTVLPLRRARLETRVRILARKQSPEEGRQEPTIFRVLFLSNLVREKGVFEALEAVALMNQELQRRKIPIRAHLTVGGPFPEGGEQKEFEHRISRADLKGSVQWVGFVAGEAKTSLLRDCDALLFPTFYHAESFPVVLIEAMAAGMAIVTTRWRALPEILPPGYTGLVPPNSPESAAKALVAALAEDSTGLRESFKQRLTETAYINNFRAAFLSIPAK